jgi:hypothetical protein
MKKSLQFSLLLLALLIFSMPELSAQCTMCKSNLEMARQNGSTEVGNTINDGILYLLALPYLIAGAFAYIYFKKYKEKKNALSTQP